MCGLFPPYVRGRSTPDLCYEYYPLLLPQRSIRSTSCKGENQFFYPKSKFTSAKVNERCQYELIDQF